MGILVFLASKMAIESYLQIEGFYSKFRSLINREFLEVVPLLPY